ncbi:MAG: hypothetical protein V7K55_21230, partial [Nostoc sp.]|uniref:hypothetical protein n=1 Tax=Nostoc sp. TaxID=1180 RepID=UPI002FFB1FB3
PFSKKIVILYYILIFKMGLILYLFQNENCWGTLSRGLNPRVTASSPVPDILKNKKTSLPQLV